MWLRMSCLVEQNPQQIQPNWGVITKMGTQARSTDRDPQLRPGVKIDSFEISRTLSITVRNINIPYLNCVWLKLFKRSVSLSSFFVLFLSWVAKTQLNLWTKWVVLTFSKTRFYWQTSSRQSVWPWRWRANRKKMQSLSCVRICGLSIPHMEFSQCRIDNSHINAVALMCAYVWERLHFYVGCQLHTYVGCQFNSVESCAHEIGLQASRSSSPVY